MKQVLGIDVGGTKIATGLVNARFQVSHLKVVPTSQTDLIGQLTNLIANYSNYAAIGLAVPGPVSPDGLVVRFPNIPHFKSTNLKKLFEKKFKVPVGVVNDAKAFAYAEAILGAGKNYQTLAGVTLGTGIGVGLINRGQIYFGANSLAGEFGHVLMPNGQIFEQYVKSAGKFKNAKQAGKYLRILLSLIVRSVDPEIIIFGGGWSNLTGMERELKIQLAKVRNPKPQTVIKISKIKHAGIVGAALLARQK